MIARANRIAVIGGGASGCMAAITAAELGANVTLFERNGQIGRKLMITGKGRCNLTNNCAPDKFLPNVVTNAKFLSSAIHKFTPSDTMDFFESIGVPLKTERGSRVFPKSDKASDITDALKRRLDALGVTIAAERVRTLDFERFDRIILCTGGVSYPKTGSDGDGFRIAEKLGHSVTPRYASLVPLAAGDAFCGQMQGLSLRNVKISLMAESNTKPLYSGFGEMMFTDFGVTGPLILSASAFMRPEYDRVTLDIDLKPALSREELDERVLRDFKDCANKDFRNALDKLLPRLLIPVLIERSGIPPHTKVNLITKEQRIRLIELLKRFTVGISGTRPIDEAVITRGGVSVKEVNPTTMESKLIPNLYFAGEMLDTDAYTGGFNLQIAWSTGRLAGVSAAYKKP
ncbi:MAG: NAD(P)/FAD-dependent oxidoreductase [Oscillospiraceae bacterium]|jgi:predicted Rossmann fold flavoprotein|nr:NAD(P)/FAD-dependent oxidoreductase [Oscillospiraceae bacterium]